MAPRALSRSLMKVTRPVLQKRGADYAALVAGWAEIAGPRLAGDTAVDRLARPRDGGPGVLHPAVEPALAVCRQQGHQAWLLGAVEAGAAPNAPLAGLPY